MIESARKTAAQTPQSRGWTQERRARQAAAIKIWAPWAQSTGPKTKIGKARSAQNARKHVCERPMKAALRAQARYLADMKRHFRAEKFFGQNELLKKRLKNRRRALHRRGRKVTLMLRLALIDNIMQKTCFFPPPAANS